MSFETNKGVNCGFSCTRGASKFHPVTNGPLDLLKHSNWSSDDNFMVLGSKDLSLLPNR
ncbi:hypothetical protein MKW92_051647, partial [Papaver armeniacum]